MKSDSPSWFCFFNSSMLWGAGLGWLIATSIAHLQETTRHEGPGIVTYGDGERTPERDVEVSEIEYKRHNYEAWGMMLGLGCLVWFIVAKAERDSTAKAEAKVNYLEAQIRRADAYSQAFAAAVDDTSRARASAAALSSAQFQEAKEDQERLSRIYSAACKQAAGDAG